MLNRFYFHIYVFFFLHSSCFIYISVFQRSEKSSFICISLLGRANLLSLGIDYQLTKNIPASYIYVGWQFGCCLFNQVGYISFNNSMDGYTMDIVKPHMTPI